MGQGDATKRFFEAKLSDSLCCKEWEWYGLEKEQD